MSDFWDRNKGSIMSGIATAGKVGYQGTKFVAKTGYKAGKQQYNNSRGINKERSESSESLPSAPLPASSLVDVTKFPPPPLKPGQNQYHGGKGGSSPVPASVPTVFSAGAPQTTSNTNLAALSQQVSQQMPQTAYPSTTTAYPSTTTATHTAPAQNYGQVRSATSTTYQTEPLPTPPTGLSTNSPATLPSYTPTTQHSSQTLHLDTASIVTHAPNITQRAVPAPASIPPAEFNHHPAAAPQNAPPQLQTPQPSITPKAPEIPGRTYIRAPAALPDHVASEQIPAPALTTAAEDQKPASSTENSGLTSPIGNVNPYKWKDPEELRESMKIKIQSVDLAVLPTPPVHRHRSQSPTSLTSSPGASLTERISHKPQVSIPPSPKSDNTGTLNNSTQAVKNTSGDDLNHSEPQEEQPNRGIAGKYDSVANVSFPPPPKPSKWEPQAPVSAAPKPTARITPNPTNRSKPPLPQRASTSSSIPSSSETSYKRTLDKPNLDKAEPRKGIAGHYNSEITMNFQPPPKPFRSGSELSQPERKVAVSHATQNKVPAAAHSHGENNPVPPPAYSPVELPPRQRVDSPAALSNGLSSNGIALPGTAGFEIPKTKKMPPLKKALPEALQSASTDSIEHIGNSSHSKSKAKTPPPKPARKESLNLISRTGSTTQGQSNGLRADLEAALKFRQTPSQPGSKSSLKKPSSVTDLKSQGIAVAPPPVKPKAPSAVKKQGTVHASHEPSTNDAADIDNDNPFQRYLRNAVPLENDRLHKA